MQNKSQWPPYMELENHPALNLPGRPGIKRRFKDSCPRCCSIHLNAEETASCRQANAQREQF